MTNESSDQEREHGQDQKQEPDTRRQSASHALHGYQERRRRRRADDTYFGSADVLVGNLEEDLEERELQRRLSEFIAEAEAAGMSRDLAERIYEVAREEGIDPLLAFELVRSGLGVTPPEEGVSNAPTEPTSDKYLPEWMFPPMPPDSMLRERMLRFSFRRLRKLLEEHEELDDAFHAFADEPDVDHVGY